MALCEPRAPQLRARLHLRDAVLAQHVDLAVAGPGALESRRVGLPLHVPHASVGAGHYKSAVVVGGRLELRDCAVTTRANVAGVQAQAEGDGDSE